VSPVYKFSFPLACWSCKFLHCYVYTIDATHMSFCMKKMTFTVRNSLTDENVNNVVMKVLFQIQINFNH
jgi:hypothetical protein